jgi:hypothetical protein
LLDVLFQKQKDGKGEDVLKKEQDISVLIDD